MKSFSVGRPQRCRRPAPVRPPPRRPGRARSPRCVRRSAARRPPCRNTPYGRLFTPYGEPSAPAPRSRHRSLMPSMSPPLSPSPQPDQIGQWFRRCCTSRTRSTAGAGRSRRGRGPARPAATGSVAASSSATVVHLGALGGGERGGQHVEEAVVGEAGLRVGCRIAWCSPAVSLNGSSRSRQAQITAASSTGVGNSSAASPPVRNFAATGSPSARACGERVQRAQQPAGQRDLGVDVDAGQPLGELEQLGQAGQRVLAALGDRHLDLPDRRSAGRRRRAPRRSRPTGTSPMTPTGRSARPGRAGRPAPAARRRAPAAGRPGRRTRRRGAAGGRPRRRAARRCRAGRRRRRRRGRRRAGHLR